MNKLKAPKILLILTFFVCIILSACKKNKSENIQNISSPEATQTHKIDISDMTLEQYEQISIDTAQFALDISDFFIRLSDLGEKYIDDIGSSETFDWSQYWDFRELKSDISASCTTILQYDSSTYPCEFQPLIDESKAIAHEMVHYCTMISEEKDIYELSNINNGNSMELDIRNKKATIYHTQATISYMETHNGNKNEIQKLKNKLKDYIDIDRNYLSNPFNPSSTKCMHQGCENFVEATGETNYCIIHSSTCLTCQKYIDENAWFCTNCLEKNIAAIDNTNIDSYYFPATYKCQYQYLDGTICGKETFNGLYLCNMHLKELNDTYNYLTGE